MKSTKTPNTLIIGDQRMGGLPYIVKAEDSDQWPNPVAKQRYEEIVCEVVRRGYYGVRAESYRLDDRRFYVHLETNPTTPEGRLIAALGELGRMGQSMLPSEAIAILERVYEEQGLQLPAVKGAAA